MRASEPREPRRRALVIDPDAAVCATAASTLDTAGFDATCVADAETGLRVLGAQEPELLVLELDLRGKDGRWLLRRLRDDFMGARPRVVVHTASTSVRDDLGDLGVDVVVLKPAHPRALVVAASTSGEDGAQGRAERLRDLVKLSVLDGELGAALGTLAQRLAIGFRTTECIVAAQVGERQRTAAARGPDEAGWEPHLGEHCRAALEAGAPVLASTDRGVETFLGVPLRLAGSVQLGYLVLIDETARRFPPDTLDELRALAQRLHGELAWRSVHERIAADRDRLRETSMLDPMLPGLWTRAALEQALPGEVAACVRRGEPMSVAVVDLVGLRHLNERHGHLAGDAALRHLAQVVRSSVRTPDLVARYAGDSLAVVLPGAPLADAQLVIERIRQSVAATPLEHDQARIALSVSAAIALRGDDEPGEGALARAEAALNSALRGQDSIVIAAAVEAAPRAPVSDEGLPGGTTLGGMYQILHEISRGAMGVVYRAEDLGLGRPVALKTLRPDLARDRGFVQRFRAEAALLASFRHENLVQVYAFGQDGDDVYFVMELVEGEPLEDRVELARHEGQHVPVAEVERVIVQIGDALDAMHSKGILHRDVKPANILLDRARDRAVLVDVGIAKKRGTPNDPAGTPGFTAPESFTGGTEAAQADVYGLAATAYTLLTAEMPFHGAAADEIIAAQRHSRPEPASKYRAGLPPAVDQVLGRSLDPDPARRYATASSFARALAASLDNAIDAGGPVATDGEPEPDTDVRAALAERKAARVPAPVLPITEPREPDSPPVLIPHTRGVLFRAVYRVLGAQQAAQWVSGIGKHNPALAAALQPQTTLLSWHPTELFVALLQAIGNSGRDPRRFARELGKVATAATFSRFFGADAGALTPSRVLAATDTLWRRYHTWGQVEIQPDGTTGAFVRITNTPRDALVCESTAGILEQVAALAVARDAQVDHRRCEAQGSSACVFGVHWELPK